MHKDERLRERPEGVAASSLDIVEAFTGVQLSDDGEIVRAVNELPLIQLMELRQRLLDYIDTCRSVFEPRTQFNRQEAVAKLPANEVEGVRQYIGKELHVHESSLASARQRGDLANIPALKHLALYCESVWLEDPLAPPLESWLDADGSYERTLPRYITMWRASLADGLRQLQPMAGLVRMGHLVLASPKTTIRGRRRLPFMGDDPFTDYLLTHEHPQLANELEEAQMAALNSERSEGVTMDERDRLYEHWQSLGDQADVVLAQSYPHHITAEDIRRIKDVRRLTNQYPWVPVTSSPAMSYHLEQCARVRLDGHPGSAVSPTSIPPSPAISYGIPSLSEVSFADIIRLRQNESVFKEVRNSLVSLAAICAEVAMPDSYDSYKTAVHDYAKDIIHPAHERLLAMQRNASVWGLIGVGVGRAVSLGIHAAGKTGHAPGVGHLAGPAGSMTQKAIGRAAEGRHRDATVALGILKSIMSY